MITYHKINSIFKRDAKGKFINEYSKEEFKYLENSEWIWTEKVDGTNIRIGFDGEKVEIGGRTDKAQLSIGLIEVLQSTFTKEKLSKVFPDLEDCQVVLFGEGYGNNIQKVARQYSDDYKFILFDIQIGNVFLKREALIDISKKLEIDLVPVCHECSLLKMIEIIKKQNTYSRISKEPNFLMEGVVGYPTCGFKDRMGRRIITKLKHKDFLTKKRKNENI